MCLCACLWDRVWGAHRHGAFDRVTDIRSIAVMAVMAVVFVLAMSVVELVA